MAIETTKGGFTSREFVAAGAVGGAIERRMRAGERSGRNLCGGVCRQEQNSERKGEPERSRNVCFTEFNAQPERLFLMP